MINEFQKFPTNKEAYDKNYERVFGKCRKKQAGIVCPGKIECYMECVECECYKQGDT